MLKRATAFNVLPKIPAVWLVLPALGLILAPRLLIAQATNTITIEHPEMAGISGFRAYWDKPVPLAEDGATRISDQGAFGSGPVADWSTDKPGAVVFDAVHRSLLLRFPDAAEQIAKAVKSGLTIEKVEIVFNFVDTEYFPMDYVLPDGMSFMGDLWVRLQPRWHAVGWALREPWKTDAQYGPTFNASVNGKRYWAHFGGQDETSDRFANSFGPTEISTKSPQNGMDVTALFTGASYGKTLAERLRTFTDCGIIVRKWETYDALYNNGGYEFGGAPGHRGIRIKAPKLIVTLSPGNVDLGGELPPPADVANLPASGQPTAVLPSAAHIKEMIETYAFKRAAGMPQWQWQRIEELFAISKNGGGGFPATEEAYLKWIDEWLAVPYRQFRGHHTTMSTHDCLLYAQTWPAPVREHMKKYWDAWLLPGRPYTELQHNQWMIWTKEGNSYYNTTGDWRGNHSFYRDSYTRFMSTMNFNHNAIIAALLGGSFTGNAEAMDDGRFGLETILLRLWSWYDGTTQESIDHYYLGLSLYGQKSFQDLAPTELDRIMGHSMLIKTMDELASCYHPGFKRFIATAGRTGVAEMLGINEGVNSILHTVSKKGALHDVDNPDRLGMPVAGTDLPPDLVARQAMRGAWMPLWMGNIVDDKPLPYELTASYKQWGGYREKPLWKRSYLGRNYGLATLDISVGNETIPVMAQWRREAQPADHLQDTGLLLMRYGINTTEFYDTIYHGTTQANPNGSVGTQGGHTVALQHRNKAIVLTSPFDKLEYSGGRPIPEKITSLQSSIAIANYQKNPTWKIYIDGQPLGELPAKARINSRITIDDGETFIGIIPLPATDLGRTEEVLITTGGEPVVLQGGGKAAPTLIINSYNYYNQNVPLDKTTADWKKIDRASGGFIIEMGEQADFPTFADFQKHLDATKVETQWQESEGILNLTYTTGTDKIELGFRPEYEGGWGKIVPSDRCFTYRRVNGEWPYLPEGMDRDTTLSQQGRTGRLEKAGAVLCSQPGLMAYLLVEPISGNVLFANPLPDPQYMTMDVPGGVRVRADGRLGLMHLIVNPKENSIDLNYALKPAQRGANMAEGLYFFGLADKPRMLLNGAELEPSLIELEGAKAWRVALVVGGAVPSPEAIVAKYDANASPQAAGLSTQLATQAKMRYKPGQEHYILTEPENGTYSFWRQWPGESPIEVTVPGGVRVATDGNIALQRIQVNAAECRIQIDYAPYLQSDKEGNPIKDRAKALVIFGMASAPSVILHGKPYTGSVESVKIGEETAYMVPLFGAPSDELRNGIGERLAAAAAKDLGD